MLRNKKTLGFTLIELMIAVAIIGILAGIAIPVYNGYLSSSRGGVGTNNVDVLRSLEENYRLDTKTYLAGTYVGGNAANAFTKALHWELNNKDKFTYTVTAGSTGDIKTSLKITATCVGCGTPLVTEN